MSHVTLARPAEVVILRHAEKPADDRDPSLSRRGWERANALPAFLTNSPAVVANGPPVALFAARPTRHGHGRRAEETLTPTAHALGFGVKTPYEANDFRSLARMLDRTHEFDGKTVIVCWEHDHIPALAAELGVQSPPHWKGSDFDHAWIITLAKSSATLKIVPQLLLPGDSRH